MNGAGGRYLDAYYAPSNVRAAAFRKLIVRRINGFFEANGAIIATNDATHV